MQTARGLRLLHQDGWGPAHRVLRDLRPGPGADAHGSLPPPVAVRLAHRELPGSHIVLRLCEPNALCLPRSFAFALWLSALGLPAEVVVARQRTSVSARFAFHAWTELHGEVLNDIPGVRTGYGVLQRVSSRHLAGAGAR